MKIIKFIDYTSLNETDTENTIATFCSQAINSLGHVAAVCVYPQFVRLVAAEFAGTPVKVTTVANFPQGSDSLESVLIAIGRALEDGAQEMDIVFPYSRYLAGERQYAQTFVTECKAACGADVMLKVILETGALNDLAIIADASRDVLAAGADFIKTSTGKIPQGITLEAAATTLLVIKEMSSKLKRHIGFKASGGIKELQQAAQYLALAEHIMGPAWISPHTFRIGSSKLVDKLLLS